MGTLRSVIRRLASTPAFTLTAVLTLALAVGANTAIFGILHSLVLRPLPYPEPDRMVALEQAITRSFGERPYPWSYARFDDVRSLARSFEATAAFAARAVSLTGTGQPERLEHETVSGAYFDVLRVHADLGRTIAVADDDVGDPQPVAVIADGLWRRRFGGEPGVLGATLHLDGRAYTVIGVMAPDFRGMGRATEVWTPLAWALATWARAEGRTDPGSSWLNAMARLTGGVSLDDAAAELDALRPRLEELHASPQQSPIRATVRPLLDARVDPSIRRAAWILFASVGIVLVIACANLANLMLARSLERTREFAVRRAIGASRAALVRLTLIESLVLGLLGGIAALLLAAWGMDLLSGLRPRQSAGFWAEHVRVLDPGSVGVTNAVLMFNLFLALFAGLLFGIVPALRAAHIESGDALRASVSGASEHTRRRPRRVARGALIVAQMALAVVLVSGAGLVVRSFGALVATSTGALADRMLTFRLDLARPRYDNAALVRGFQDRLLGRLEALPGVTSVTLAHSLPVSGQNAMTVAAPAPQQVSTPAALHMVSNHYFDAFGIPLRGGRIILDSEHAARTPVAVINETAARTFFPGGGAVGATLDIAGAVRQVEVVGIVADVKYDGIGEPAAAGIYLSRSLWPAANSYVVLRTAGDPAALLERARSEVLTLDPDLPLFDVRTMEERVAAAVSATRFISIVLALFAALALALAAVGVYGVVSGAARARSREIGIRMALGARAGRVLRDVLQDALLLALVALAAGIPASLAATRVLRGVLYEVEPHDPATFAGVAVLIVATALLASWIPARRAARTDPIRVLRHE